MEYIKDIINKLFSVKTWNQVFKIIILTLFFLFSFIFFERRAFILNYNSIPKSEVETVQKNLEIEKILRIILHDLKADRVYIMQFIPPILENSKNPLEIEVVVTHEQLEEGVKSIREIYEGNRLTKFKMDYSKVYFNGLYFLNLSEDKDNHFLRYHMKKSNVECFVISAIFNSENQEIKRALVIEFSKELNEEQINNVKNLIRNYSGILTHYSN